MTLEEDLQIIWNRYEPQRDAECNAMLRDQQAREELVEFNKRRAQLGLNPVTEYQHREPSNLMAHGYSVSVGPAPKTWRDDLDAEILVAVKKHFNQT